MNKPSLFELNAITKIHTGKKLVRGKPSPMALEQRFMFDGAAVGDAVQLLSATTVDSSILVDAGRTTALAGDLFKLVNATAETASRLNTAQAEAERLVAEFLQRPDAKAQLFSLFNGGQTEASAEWQKAADDFYVLDECELRDTHEDGGIVRCKRQDLTSEEIQLHLSTGKVVTQLSLAWQDKLSFMLDDKMTVKRLKFEDLLQDQAEQDGGDEALGQLVASFVLMMLTFREFVPALLEALGGEEIPQGI